MGTSFTPPEFQAVDDQFRPPEFQAVHDQFRPRVLRYLAVARQVADKIIAKLKQDRSLTPANA